MKRWKGKTESLVKWVSQVLFLHSSVFLTFEIQEINDIITVL